MSATGHYVLSFVTTSEMEISPLTGSRSCPALSELIKARVVPNDTSAEMVCFVAFVIFVVPGTDRPGSPKQFDHIDRPPRVVN